MPKKKATYCENSDQENYDFSASDDDFVFSPEPRHKIKKRKKVQSTASTDQNIENDSDLLFSPSSDDDDNEDEDDAQEIPDENDEPQAMKKQRSKKKKCVPEITYQWCSEDITEESLIEQVQVDLDDPEKTNPIDYFLYYFDEEILQLIVEQTNLYSSQRDPNQKPLNLTVRELKVFIGVWIFMGICSLPSYHDYWTGVT